MIALEFDGTCVELLEEGDTENPRLFEKGLQSAIEDRHHRQVVFDLSRLRELTSASVAVLLAAEACALIRGTPVAFACARRRVKRALVLAGVRELLEVHASVGRALEALGERGAVACRPAGQASPGDGQRKEAAMGDEREERDVGQEGARGEDAEAAAGEHPGDVGGPREETEAQNLPPARCVPESILERLRESAPELAKALPGQAEGDVPEETPQLPGGAEPAVPEVETPQVEAPDASETRVAATAGTTVPDEEPGVPELPGEPLVPQEGPSPEEKPSLKKPAPRKRASRKGTGKSRRKPAGKGRRKPRARATAGRAKQRKKAQA